MQFPLDKISDNIWEVPTAYNRHMRVPARIYADRHLLDAMMRDDTLTQAVNITQLPGLVKYGVTLPDGHQGYGFPIGGVGAFDMDEGIITPGGVGYDINCGVRLMRTDLTFKEVDAKKQELINEIFKLVPCGVGVGSKLRLSTSELERAISEGIQWAVDKGYGWDKDASHSEEGGGMKEANPDKVSHRALKRGSSQLGTLGAGNHFLEIAKVDKIGNNLGLPEPALKNTLEGLEEDIEDETGVVVRLPLDVQGAEILVVTPSADFFAEPHIDGLIGYAKVFHAAGASWTVSSYASEAANFAMFIGSYEQMKMVAERIRKAAQDLGVKRIIFGECGHAWRVAYSFMNTLAGPFDFLDPKYPVPQHICEYTWDLIERGKLNLDKSANDHMTLTFHDSCNVARASRMGDTPGGQFEIPRNIIRAVCNNFVDMAADTIHEATFCCGGGGGLLTDDLMEIRIKGASPRMTALQEVVEEHGVTHMAAICAICKTQFAKIMPTYGMGMDRIVSLHQLVSNAIILEGQEGSETEAETDTTENVATA